ncbi:MAG: hypothetical protein CL678_03975 [Bdellovibrionaceae bacterium]|nr:hypothetical protein [Pseudobdellovibrionaceae bacterium]|tara:strand:+ start:3189 stop:3593 length:405 start_codon:yes stop_codon:yes gene_type:complete
MDLLKNQVDELNEEQLRELESYILLRREELRSSPKEKKIDDFFIGQEICFTSSEGELIFGMITGFSETKVSVHTENGRQWRVSPFLIKDPHEKEEQKEEVSILPLRTEGLTRNSKCPCGSGKKFKRCCRLKKAQ